MKFIKYLLVLFTCSAYASMGDVKEIFTPELGVEFPTSFGVHGKFNFNRNMYFRLGLGSSSEILLKNMYRTNLTSVEPGRLDLITDSLANSLYSDVRLGFRSSRKQGFYGEAGYSVMSLGKGETSASRLEAIGRQNLQTDILEVQSVVHNATVHGGYFFPLIKKVGLSIEVGVIKPLFSDVKIDYQQLEIPVDMEQEDSKAIESIFKEIFVLTGSLWLSYVF